MKKEKAKKSQENKREIKKRTAPAVVVIESEPNARGIVEGALKDNGSFGGITFGTNLDEALKLIKANDPDLVILGDDDGAERSLSFIERIAVSYPEITIIFSAYSEDSTLLIRAMRAGVREFLKRPLVLDEFNEALTRYFSARSVNGFSVKTSGKIISVFGVKGGLGTTTLATNLGININNGQGKSVVLMDANFYSGSLCVFLDMQPKLSIADLLRDIDQVEPNSLKKVLPRHSTGVYFLAPPKSSNGAMMISNNDIGHIFSLLRVEFDYTIVDLDRAIDTMTADILEETDLLMLTVNLDVPSLVNTNKTLEMLQRLGFDEKKIMLVSNRHNGKNEYMLDEFQQITKKSIDWKIPNFKYPICLDSVNRGEPLAVKAGRSKVNQSIMKLARSIDNKFNRPE